MYINANRNTKIISGFPAIGKSFFRKNSTLQVLDNDSSLFSHLYKDVPHPDFPENYMRHTENNVGRVHYILVSTHKDVREALNERKIDYTIVYPSIELKGEYIERMKTRGNTQSFINLIDSKWEEFINDIEKETHPKLIKLESGQFLSDVLNVAQVKKQASVDSYL